jgi:solute carrier family 25 protein 38
MRSPLKEYTRGLGTSLAREGLYTLFHYNIYRFLKDDIFQKKFNRTTTFVPAFVAGLAAITVSQPFEVLRNKISLNNFQGSVWIFVGKYFREAGPRGFFVGFVPRLLRKPINSGICWTILESLRRLE